MKLVRKMIDEWNAVGTPVEVCLAEALEKLERAHEERQKLQWRIYCQRLSLRQNWMIVEQRNKMLGTKSSRERAMFWKKRWDELRKKPALEPVC